MKLTSMARLQMVHSGVRWLPASRAVPPTNSAGLFTRPRRADSSEKKSDKNRQRITARMSPPVRVNSSARMPMASSSGRSDTKKL